MLPGIYFPQRIFCISVDDINITDGVMLKGNFNANELHENKKISNVPASVMHDRLPCPVMLVCVEEYCGS